jgi:hypothetical protein
MGQMTVQNLTTARFVLQCLHAELEEYDRCTPVARNIQVGDVTDALLAILNDRRILRLTMPARSAPRRRRAAGGVRPTLAKRKARATRMA